ncbi:MAG TPA: hypothetical protein VGQ36_26020 [Thermoanaerobaculia bacterium]|jgi:peptidoglycan/LPS O-acetylase OafA/YrhL|nr:hypothetical protein [Thermoanaerobaculia bacterium]
MPSKRIAIILGVIGIAIEVIAVVLISQKRIPTTYGIPLVVAGMFLAFVPLFVLARMKRR